MRARWPGSTRRCVAPKHSPRPGPMSCLWGGPGGGGRGGEEAPGDAAQMEKLGRAFDTPLLVNMVEGGATPVLPQAELERMGFRIAIFPASGVLATVAALEKVYAALKTTGASANAGVPLQRFDEFLKLMGFPDV